MVFTQNLGLTLALIRTKNTTGFELLYARYYRFLFSTAYMVLRQESDAMDAVQNAALRLYIEDNITAVDVDLYSGNI